MLEKLKQPEKGIIDKTLNLFKQQCDGKITIDEYIEAIKGLNKDVNLEKD